jgi:hypothetical protein
MPPRALWAVALVAAALADAAGEAQIAFYLALATVSVGGVVVLGTIGDLVDARGRRAALRVTLLACGLALTVIGAAMRGPLVAEGTVPAFASSALVFALVALGLELAAAAVPAPRRRTVTARRRTERTELRRAA